MAADIIDGKLSPFYVCRMIRSPFLVLISLLTGCSASEKNLSAIVAFESAAECRLTPDAQRFFDAMTEHGQTSGATRGRPVETAGMGTLQVTFSGPDKVGMMHAHLPLTGAWHGLTMIGLASGFVPNTGVHYRRILFAEPRAQVRERLNSMGFDLPPAGRAREFGDGMTEYISLISYRSGSALDCGT